MKDSKRAANALVQRATLGITVAVIVINGSLSLMGIIAPPTAILLFLAVEIPLGIIATTVGITRYRALRNQGNSAQSAFESVAGIGVARAIRSEIQLYRSLWLWIRGKKDGSTPSTKVIGYTKGTFGVFIAFGLVTLVEIVAVHFLVPWHWLRLFLLVASLYGLMLLLSFIASRVVHPHLLSHDQLIIRDGKHVVGTVPVDQIKSAITAKRYNPTVASEESGRLYLPCQDGTNVDLELTLETVIQLPGVLKRQRRIVPIASISLFVDNPDDFVKSITEIQNNPRESATGWPA